MNKKVKWNAVHIIAWILMAALLAGIIPANQIIVPAASVITASAEKPDDSGKCGENVKWEFFEEEGLLVISGKGDMINYSYCPPTPPVDRDPEIIPGDPPQKPYSLTLPTEREDEIIPGRIQTDLGFEANSKRVLSEAWQTVDDSSPETLPVEDPPWEKYVSKIQRIRIEEGVTSIGAVSFDSCEALTDIEIAGSVTKIGPGAFSGDVKLTSVRIPISVENMGEGVFSGCSSLTDVQLPENLHYVPASMFSGCTSLQSVRLPQFISSIGYLAFLNCRSLESIYLPDGLQYIGIGAFSGCSNLESIQIPVSLEEMGSETFSGCCKLKSVRFGENFNRCREYTFEGCDELKEIYFTGDAPWFSDDAFGAFSYPPQTDLHAITATVYYPQNNSTWDKAIQQSYGGEITWRPWEPSADPVNISSCDIVISQDYYTYDGLAKIPSVTVQDGADVLVLEEDYTLSYSDNINAGTATVSVTGINNYTGLAFCTFTIAKAPAVLTFAAEHMQKTAKEAPFINPLTARTDGSIIYSSDNADVAEVSVFTGEVMIHKPGTAKIMAQSTEGDNYLSGTASYLLNVNHGIGLDSLTYSFSNSRKDFGYPMSYRIPLDVYQVLFDPNLAEYFYKGAGLWRGNCGGCSISSLLFNMSGSGIIIDLFRASAKNVSDLKLTDFCSKWEFTLLKFIEMMQVSQYDAAIQRCYNKNTDLNELCAAIEDEDPVVIAVFGPEGGHALVGYRIEKIAGDKARLYVYDCNFPKAERYITLETDGTGIYTGWYYHLNDRYHWGSAYPNCRISFVPYPEIQKIWDRKNIAAAQNVVSINGDGYEIQDEDGNTIAWERDGDFNSREEEIYELKPVGLLPEEDILVEDGGNMVYLPTEVYQIKNTGSEEELKVDMIHVKQDVSVTTMADNVLLAVDDNQEVNRVSIDAQKGDRFHVVLNSALDNDSGIEKLEVTGIGIGAGVTLGIEEGNCILTNCSGVTVRINGDAAGSAGSAARTDISGLQAALAYTSCTADGNPKEPNAVLKNGAYTLKNGQDYILVYQDNITPGKARAVLYGIGQYFGTLILEFAIKGTAAEHVHAFGSWTMVKKPTALSAGIFKRTCQTCQMQETENIARLNPTVKFNMTTIPLKVGQSTKAFKVSGLAEGDFVALYQSSNKAVATVTKNGKITGKRKGTAQIRVTLASGKSADVIVKVQKEKVKTKKLVPNKKNITLKKEKALHWQ